MKTTKLKFIDFWRLGPVGSSDISLSSVGRYFENEDTYGELQRLLIEHCGVELSDSPEVVLCSRFPMAVEKRTVHNYDCLRIFYTGENVIPDFELYDYGIGFAHIDNPKRYIRWPLYALCAHSFDMALTKHELDARVELRRRKKFCAAVISNGEAAQERATLLHELSEYKHVVSAGRYLNNRRSFLLTAPFRKKPLSVLRDRFLPVRDKYKFLRGFKFSLAGENSSSPGYITEKIVQAWAAGTIPIYWGAPDIVEEFNPDAFVNANDRSFKDVVDEVASIDNDSALYECMLKAPILGEQNQYRAAAYIDRRPLIDFFLHAFEQGRMRD